MVGLFLEAVAVQFVLEALLASLQAHLADFGQVALWRILELSCVNRGVTEWFVALLAFQPYIAVRTRQLVHLVTKLERVYVAGVEVRGRLERLVRYPRALPGRSVLVRHPLNWATL